MRAGAEGWQRDCRLDGRPIPSGLELARPFLDGRPGVAGDPRQWVDLWVLALQICQSPAEYDPLDLSRWAFRVISHRELLSHAQASDGNLVLDRKGIAPVGYDALGQAIASRGR
jgi:hypothetical protein